MRFIYILLLLFFTKAVSLFAISTEVPYAGAQKVIERVLKRSDLPIRFELDPSSKYSFFEYSVKNGILYLRANSNVSLCSGFYDYVKANHMGLHTWSGNNIELPERLPDYPKTYKQSEFKHNYYLNVVTYGYSTPYWDWNRWEQEIDWMAFHGYDMPLTLMASEAIMSRVYKKFGLSDEEIASYFTGAAHLPFLRMGLMENLDGPLREDWHAHSVDLQHKVLDRMRELGMKPICPAFAGFVPKEIKNYYPDIEITLTTWSDTFHNWMISPEEELFKKMGTAFIHEWEKEFGACEYYISDSFNEMEIPFPAKGDPARYELLSRYGNVVYESIKNGNPEAVWVMQGWMFGFQRDIWDYETLAALVRKVPKGKILLLDLAVDYNKTVWNSEVNWDFYKGFFEQPWIYSTIPNMGGKIGWTGNLEFYANGHLEVIQSNNRGNLIGYGTAPEGIENNEVIYELLTDARWSNDSIRLKDWLKNYSLNRYGQYTPGLESYWDGLLKSTYASLEPHPRFNWQFSPGSVKKGSICMTQDTYDAIEAFLSESDKLKTNSFYEADVAEATAMYVGGKLELLANRIETLLIEGDLKKAAEQEELFIYLMDGLDKILSDHPTLRLDKWLQFADKCGVTAEQKEQYIENAKRIVTIWGPPINDYAARIWSGIIKGYYLPRWKLYFDALRNQRTVNVYDVFEKNWVESNNVYIPARNEVDMIRLAHDLVGKSKMIAEALVDDSKGAVLGSWKRSDLSLDSKELVFHVPLSYLAEIKNIQFMMKNGTGSVCISDLVLIGDGKELFRSNVETEINSQKTRCSYTVRLQDGTKCNNYCELRVRMTGDPNVGSTGEIILIK